MRRGERGRRAAAQGQRAMRERGWCGDGPYGESRARGVGRPTASRRRHIGRRQKRPAAQSRLPVSFAPLRAALRRAALHDGRAPRVGRWLMGFFGMRQGRRRNFLIVALLMVRSDFRSGAAIGAALPLIDATGVPKKKSSVAELKRGTLCRPVGHVSQRDPTISGRHIRAGIQCSAVTS